MDTSVEDRERRKVERIRIGRLPVDAVDQAGALASIEELVRARRGGTVFTPNVDHVVTVEHNARFRAAYQRVSLSLVDGMPVLWASRLVGRTLPEKVSGSDLVVPLMERAATCGWRVFLLGGAPGAAETAARRLVERLPGLQIVGTAAPQIAVGGKADDRLAIARRISVLEPDLVLVAFGAPKQELFCDDVAAILKPAVLVCVGAGLDFVAGSHTRSPAWMSRWGLEWLYRLIKEPRRLAARYLLHDPEFLVIVIRQLLRGESDHPAPP